MTPYDVPPPSPITTRGYFSTRSSNPESAEVKFALQILLIHVRFCICNRRVSLSPSANQLTSNVVVQRASSAPEELRSYHNDSALAGSKAIYKFKGLSGGAGG